MVQEVSLESLEKKQIQTNQEITQKLLKRLAIEEDFGFETFDDPALELMLKSAQESLSYVVSGDFRWLTFSGPTEVGKTHLLKGIRSFLKRYDASISLKNKFGFSYYKYYAWPTLCQELIERTTSIKEIENTGCLLIEEFLASKFINTLEIAKAQEVLNCRLGKYTVIDTNKSIKEVQDIDPAIASRFYRNNGVVVDIPSGTKGFLTR